MPIKILMPALSPTMTEGNLARWLKKEGDEIKSGDVILEVETDKATMEYEATDEGVLGRILVGDGSESIAVNDLIGVILEEGEDASMIDDFIQSSLKTSPDSSIVTDEKTTLKEENISIPSEHKVASNPVNDSNKEAKKIFITPLAKRIAQQNSVDIKNIIGSGPNGRIIKHDVELFMEKGSTNIVSSSVVSSSGYYEDKANSGMRKTIASRLLESKVTIPHYYLTIDCNMENLLASRIQINDKSEGKYKISVNDFIIKAVALALKEVPAMNVSWQGDNTRHFLTSDISVAVAIPDGLITPIVKEAEKKGLVEISGEMKELAKKAKEGSLKASEYQGGSFTISNLGMFGIKSFSAIINPPQSGILAVGATEKRAIVKGDQIVVSSIMSVTLSGDHRAADGATGALFLNAFKKYIENPVNMIL